jgi:RNA polymerase sigma factor (sigma-70 family)
MSAETDHPIVRVIRRAARAESEHRTDGELLIRYAIERDSAAFETLVHRHGGLVWRVCRDVLGNSASAEDAFQATFLVLVRKAGWLHRPGILAPWLYGVAHRIALRARKSLTRSPRPLPERDVMSSRTDTRTDDRDAARVLHEEVRQLPAKYATPLVLCYLDGRTTEEVADELKWPVGTVKVRLMRGRELLKDRLTRRGIAGATIGSVVVAPTVAIAAPGELIEQTLRGAQVYAADGAVEPVVQQFLQMERHAEFGNRLLSIAVGAGLMAFVIGVGFVWFIERHPFPNTSQKAPVVKPDRELLQGTWTINTLEIDGQTIPGGSSIRLSENTFVTRSMGAEYEGTFKLNETASPKTIDMTFTKGPEKGNTALGIYKLDGDTWTICLTVTAKERPTKFATKKGSGLALEELTRGEPVQKPETASAPSTAKAKLIEEQKKELDRFAGEWAMVSGSIGGQAMPDAMLKTMKREVKGDELTVTMNGQVYFKATITLDPATTPRTIDYAMTEGMTKGKTQLGIYEWEDGNLRFSFASPGKDRPSDFSSKPDDGRTVSVWKRMKP